MGDAFEQYIRIQNQKYRSMGIAVIEKQATEFLPIRKHGAIVNAKVENPSTVDFIGRAGCVPVAFEAKHISADKLPLRAIKDHQAEFMDDWCRDPEVIGFVLISFDLNDFFIVPWFVFSACRTAWLKKGKATKEHPLTFGDFTYSGGATLKKSDLPEAWRVNKHPQYGVLHYLDFFVQKNTP